MSKITAEEVADWLCRGKLKDRDEDGNDVERPISVDTGTFHMNRLSQFLADKINERFKIFEYSTFCAVCN